MGVKINGQVAAISQDTAPTADDDYALGVQKDRNGDYRGALTDYNRAIAIDPSYPNSYASRGLLKADKFNDPQGAVAKPR
jgi:tetratricopeptide (TPR) repeat protein